MDKITHDPDKYFAEELLIQIRMFDNRKETGDPLTASEYLTQVPRDKYERLCRLALEALQHRYKHPETHEDRQKAISDFLAIPENSKSVIEGNPFLRGLIPTQNPEGKS